MTAPDGFSRSHTSDKIVLISPRDQPTPKTFSHELGIFGELKSKHAQLLLTGSDTLKAKNYNKRVRDVYDSIQCL